MPSSATRESEADESVGKQLRLLPVYSPLAERLGPGFFRAVPRQPGVYYMRDAAGTLLYVGKARNLRQRLNSYRYPAQASRKTIRLLHAVHQVEWEVCPSEPEARLRENELLRTHRPRFNRVGTWPKAYRFVQLRRWPHGFALAVAGEAQAAPPFATREDRLLLEPEARGAEPIETFGAFKAGATFALAALLRLLWLALHPEAGWAQLPRPLLTEKAPREFGFHNVPGAEWLDLVRQYLRGNSAELIEVWQKCLAEPANGFHQQMQTLDFERAVDFFERGPRRNYQLLQQSGSSATCIDPEALDDLLVLAEGKRTMPA